MFPPQHQINCPSFLEDIGLIKLRFVPELRTLNYILECNCMECYHRNHSIFIITIRRMLMHMNQLTRRQFVKTGTVLGASLAVGSVVGLNSCAHRDMPSDVALDEKSAKPVRATSVDYDVIIAGAGPGGILAARDLAMNGFSVGLFDASPEERLGKPIVIEAEQQIFDRVRIDPPDKDLIPYHPEVIRVFSSRAREAYHINCKEYKLPVALYLDRFVQKLLREAVGAGVKFYGRYRAMAPLYTTRGVEGVRFESPSGTADVRGRIVIDATGFNACLSRQLPFECGIVFPEDERDIVSAENHLHDIDVEAARAAVERGLTNDEENRVVVGNYGNYSTVFSTLSLKHQRAYILVGLKKSYENIMPVSTAIERFRGEHDYFRREITGGGGLIRIHHPLDKPVADGFMAIGEAACHVVPIHGSGVASSLYAASLASKAATQALRNGDTSETALWPYAAQFQRGRGRILAAFDTVRLSLEKFAANDVADMMETGLMNKEDMIKGLLVQLPMPSFASLPSRLSGILFNPRFVPKLAGSGITLNQVNRHYAHYPERYDREEFLAWSNEKKKIFGSLSEAKAS